MKGRAFHVASPGEIRAGEVTDVYFARTLEILRRKGLDRKRGLAEFTAGELPGGWPWAILCGLEEVAALFEGLPVDVTALPEGTLFAPKDETGVRVPVLTVEGPYGSYCLQETPALGLLCQATGATTKAARIRLLAGRAQVLAFGSRRMHPAIAPMLERASYLGGCDGVSNIVGARLLGIEPSGTMPHALVVCFGDQGKAWAAFDQVMPRSVRRVALIDTYSDEKEEALKAAQLLGERLDGVRLDTPGSRRGNFPDLVREIRWELDLRGFRKVKIMVSGGIDEEEIPALVRAGADGFGVGTAISNAPTVDFAMDLVEMEGRPCAKRGKLGGRKMVWRCPRCLSYRVLPAGRGAGAGAGAAARCGRCRRRLEPMLQPLLRKGRRVGRAPAVKAIRAMVLGQLKKVEGVMHA
ncbi:MAG: nicotinate phosphoribosyltransferase [Candidatus Omnitrophica bacterium]|nr:nicotinate phosphoribosyltransferase [Candidatus Omnitrophota bacterium]